ncbi:sterol desaturase family protein [Pleionea sediminis]|uniref:sterol desaturase family protein n=1 Tax=Pleionea sediminis TaxID=2569479 RepID=UPI0011859762|nr:sterol desaturase family protein [Pleionea sediminis]
MKNDLNIPEKTQHFRNHYRSEIRSENYNGWLHISFSLLSAMLVIVFCSFSLSNVSNFEWLTVPLTFLYANLVEYVAHRFPMHRPIGWMKIIYQRHSRQHHRFFTDKAMSFKDSRDFCVVLFPPALIVGFFIAFAMPVALIINWLLSVNSALLFMITAFAYFINYELLHTAYHVNERSWLWKLSFMRKLRKLHFYHHEPKLMSRYNFNITYPIGDWLFGTYYSGNREQTKNFSSKLSS